MKLYFYIHRKLESFCVKESFKCRKQNKPIARLFRIASNLEFWLRPFQVRKRTQARKFVAADILILPIICYVDWQIYRRHQIESEDKFYEIQLAS